MGSRSNGLGLLRRAHCKANQIAPVHVDPFSYRVPPSHTHAFAEVVTSQPPFCLIVFCFFVFMCFLKCVHSCVTHLERAALANAQATHYVRQRVTHWPTQCNKLCLHPEPDRHVGTLPWPFTNGSVRVIVKRCPLRHLRMHQQ